MIVALQRVSRASVRVEQDETHSAHFASIERGALALVGVERGDDESVAEWCADKIAALRIFPDEGGRMNRSLVEITGEAMVISQFTLAGETRKGTRPSFSRAETPELAAPLVERLAMRLEESHDLRVARGVFGAMMRVELINDGPVTLMIERRPSELK